MPEVQCTKPISMAQSTTKNDLACGTKFVSSLLKHKDETVRSKYCFSMPTSPEETWVRCRKLWFTCLSTANADAQAAVSVFNTIGLLFIVFLAHKLLKLPYDWEEEADVNPMDPAMENPLRLSSDGYAYDHGGNEGSKNAAEQNEARLFRKSIEKRFAEQERRLADQAAQMQMIADMLQTAQAQIAAQADSTHMQGGGEDESLPSAEDLAEREMRERAGFGQAKPMAKQTVLVVREEASDGADVGRTLPAQVTALDGAAENYNVIGAELLASEVVEDGEEGGEEGRMEPAPASEFAPDAHDNEEDEDDDDNDALRRMQWRASSFEANTPETGSGSGWGF
jgi:hypothetical protein